MNCLGLLYIRLSFTKVLFLSLGTTWEHVEGSLEQITCGPIGVVLGVNASTYQYRTGVNNNKPIGTSWREHSSGIGYISCGVFGCWGIKSIATAENICYFNYTGFRDENIAG